MTVQIPEDVKKEIEAACKSLFLVNVETEQYAGLTNANAYSKTIYKNGAEFGYSLSQQQLAEKDKEIDLLLAIINGEQRGINKAKEEFQQQLQSFRKKLENITVDELLKNPGIAIKLFDEEFKV